MASLSYERHIFEESVISPQLMIVLQVRKYKVQILRTLFGSDRRVVFIGWFLARENNFRDNEDIIRFRPVYMNGFFSAFIE